MIERKIEINADRPSVFSVVSDLESYPDFVPNTVSVRVRNRTSESLEADFVLRLIKEVRYTLKFQLSEPEGLSWQLVEGDFMKKNSGQWILKEKKPGVTTAIYKIDVEFGFLVPKKVVESLTLTQLPELLRAFKMRAEEKYLKERV